FRPNICALDLAPLLSEIGAKSAFIPRQSFKYLQRPWAYVSFDTESLKENVMDRMGLALQSRQLYWSARDKVSSICVQCGNNSHLYKSCPLDQLLVRILTPQPIDGTRRIIDLDRLVI